MVAGPVARGLAAQRPPSAAPSPTAAALAAAQAASDDGWDGYQPVNPIDRLRMDMPSNWPTVGKEQQAANAEQNLHDLLSVIPVVGNVVAAKDAWESAPQVGAATNEKDRRLALASTLMNTVGAFSPLPFSRTAANVAKGAGSRTNIFAGPMAKTANPVALMRAQEMEAQGLPRDEVWKATGWGRGADNKWRFEIDDSGASLAGLEKGKVARFSGIDHPELEEAYGQLPPVHGLVQPSAQESGAFMPGRPVYIAAQGRNPESAKSVTLHEFQHAAQNVEGFAMGGSPKSFARELPNGGFDNGYELYRRLAGETEARNVQARMNMTAAERRAKAPWYTQDVPDDQQIVR